MGLIDNLFAFYEYSDCSHSLIYELILDELFWRVECYELTNFGYQIYDHREFELLADLSGCLDANL